MIWVCFDSPGACAPLGARGAVNYGLHIRIKMLQEIARGFEHAISVGRLETPGGLQQGFAHFAEADSKTSITYLAG